MPRPKLHLKFKGIAPKTARAYRKEIQRFFQYLSSEEVEIPSDVSRLDFLVSEYINVLYQEGDSISQAGWLLSGLKRFIPKLRFQLPTAQQYYNNWLRDHVPMRAVPIPWLVIKGLAGLAWQIGHHDLAALLLLGFCFFLRTMEFLTLPRQNIVVDLHTEQVVVTLEKTKTSKQFQQSLVLRHRGLVRILATLLPHLPSKGPIWRASPKSFRDCFTRLLRHFALQSFDFSLYSIRRGGATHFYTATRDLHYVTLQGRWKDVRTARIYLDDARATLLKLALPPPVAHALTAAAAAWSSFR